MLAQPYPWQTAIWQDWLNQLAHQPLPHALLLSGASGLGKLNLAQALAGLLLCHQPNVAANNPLTNPACGQCASCKLIHSGFHPDLYLLEAEENSKNIRINQIRELNQEIQKSAQLGGYKVVLLNPAESLNLNAANALLKTLEEPEPKTQFILISHQPSALPATIKSRCQNWQLKTPPTASALSWLTHQLADQLTQPNQAEALLKAAAGKPLTAIKLAQPETEATRQLLADSFNQLLTQTNPLSLVVKLKNLNPLTLLNWLQTALADSLKLSLKGKDAVTETRQLALYQLINQRLSPMQLLKLDQLTMQKKQQLANNPNQELLLESLLIKIQQSCHSTL